MVVRVNYRKALVLAACFVILTGCAAAFSFSDILDWISGLFGGGKKEPQAQTQPEIVCKPPYILVGGGCCLDRNQNRICDKDETTTTARQTTTTKGTTSTQNQPTTTAQTQETATTAQATTTTAGAQAVRCNTNSDCGQAVEELLCNNGDVYLKKTIQMCKDPGKPTSSCVAKISATKAQECGDLNCIGGKCVDIYNTTTTTAPTTTVQGQTTTTLQAPANPVCGDGRLSWRGVGGTEECDGANYPCPSGLQCVNCKCTGCGDGRLQAGEECDSNSRKSRVNNQYLWDGQEQRCAGQNMVCDGSCKCVSSIQCSGSLFSTNNCDGRCNAACETCAPYQQTPCYECKKDCTRLGQGWGESSVCNGCDSDHYECQEHASCDGCYHCQETCPEGMGYYRQQGCDAKCDARLCAKVGSGQYANCYRCNAPRCGDAIVSPPGEECEKDGDCGNAKCVGCLCQFDCPGFCAGQGANGYKVTAGPATEQACKTAAEAAGNALKANCRATCWANAFGSYTTPRGVQTCCCTDADWKPCLRCPNQNPALIDCDTPLAQCKAGL